MGKKKQQKFTVKSYKTIKGRQLFFIKSKTYIRSYYFNRNKRYFQFSSDSPKFKSCSIKYKYELEDLKLAEKKVTKEKTKKKTLWSWLFVLLNIAVVAGIFINQFASGEAAGIEELFLQKANWGYLGIAVLLMVASMILEACKTYHLIWISTHRHRPFLSYKSTALCKYYDSITPMSSGGEPFQIYYLKNRGIRGEVATSIPIVKSLFWQISNSLIAIIFLVFNSGAYSGKNPLVITIAWISVFLNSLALLAIILLSLSKKVGPKIVIVILKIGAKLHIIKNYQLTFRKVMRFVLNYQNCMRSFATNFFTVLLQIFLATAEVLVSLLVPYFVYRTFAVNLAEYVSAFDVMTMTIICNMTGLIIPIPGGAGVAEFSFLEMFGGLFASDIKVWALLIWRMLSYYSVIIRGILVTIYDGVYGNKKSQALVASGYFNEKIHFSMIKRKKSKSQKTSNKLERERIAQQQQNEQQLAVQNENQDQNLVKTKQIKTKNKANTKQQTAQKTKQANNKQTKQLNNKQTNNKETKQVNNKQAKNDKTKQVKEKETKQVNDSKAKQKGTKTAKIGDKT